MSEEMGQNAWPQFKLTTKGGQDKPKRNQPLRVYPMGKIKKWQQNFSQAKHSAPDNHQWYKARRKAKKRQAAAHLQILQYSDRELLGNLCYKSHVRHMARTGESQALS